MQKYCSTGISSTGENLLSLGDTVALWLYHGEARKIRYGMASPVMVCLSGSWKSEILGQIFKIRATTYFTIIFDHNEHPW